MVQFSTILLLTNVFVTSLCISQAQLISTYSKVAHWGAGKTSQTSGVEARSRGQTFWTHSSDVSISENSKKKQLIQNPIKSRLTFSKEDTNVNESYPYTGEVQERFNPRPYFDFVFEDPTANKQSAPYKENKPQKLVSASQNLKPPSIVYGTPIISKNPPDSYSSPFNSYNPPDFKPNYSVEYPQNFPPNSITNKPEAVSSKPPQNLKPIKDQPPPLEYSSFHPPLNSPIYQSKLPIILTNFTESQHIESPIRPTPIKVPVEQYGPPQMQEEIYFTPPPDNDAKNVKPPVIEEPLEEPQIILDHPPHESSKPVIASMGEQDMMPPPSGPIPYLPQYIDHKPSEHDFYFDPHYHHHPVYHEVVTPAPTTTTTNAPRAGHYSYYYLGRKLWYIPLYFSVYFIIYITILILKSIARHKIQFTHHFDKARSGREIEHNVDSTALNAIDNQNKKFM